jgi:hypothetical protein
MKAVQESENQAVLKAAARTHAPTPDAGPDASRPALVAGSDPRLAHASGAPATLMHLQRTAGNAAVAALVGGEPPVQREPGEDDVTSKPAAGTGVTTPVATPAATAGAAGAVTSDGANTTITGAHITLDAAMTEASGVLRADTIIADSVVASSYTPGAGNVW